MNIFTLNINGLRGSDKEVNDVVNKDEMLSNLRNLKDLINLLITDKESVVILQEVPHKVLDKSKRNWNWEDNAMYQEFISVFSNQYKIIKPNHLINSNQCTIALCLRNSLWHEIDKEIIKYDEKYSYGNKLVELQYGREISLLGLHMSPVDGMWKLILNSYEKRKHTFVVGDFNAYELRGSMKNKPQQLRKMGFNACIPNNAITDFKHNSAIDNIYVDSNLKFKTSYSVSVEKTDIFQTDHALCSVKISMK